MSLFIFEHLMKISNPRKIDNFSCFDGRRLNRSLLMGNVSVAISFEILIDSFNMEAVEIVLCQFWPLIHTLNWEHRNSRIVMMWWNGFIFITVDITTVVWFDSMFYMNLNFNYISFANTREKWEIEQLIIRFLFHSYCCEMWIVHLELEAPKRLDQD